MDIAQAKAAGDRGRSMTSPVGATETVVSSTNRRNFLVGVGTTLGTASLLGPWLKRAYAASGGAYETVGAMMRFVAARPSFELALREINQTWTFSLTSPKAEITCSLPEKGPLEVEFGPNHRSPDVTISMTTADAGRYLLGELNPRGSIAVAGPSKAFMKTIPQMGEFIAPGYRRLLKTGTNPFPPPPEAVTPDEYLKGDPPGASDGPDSAASTQRSAA